MAAIAANARARLYYFNVIVALWGPERFKTTEAALTAGNP
jgi:hypothetical protein